MDNIKLSTKEMLKWYLRHTFDIVNAMKDRFGDEVLSIIHL